MRDVSERSLDLIRDNFSADIITIRESPLLDIYGTVKLAPMLYITILGEEIRFSINERNYCDLVTLGFITGETDKWYVLNTYIKKHSKSETYDVTPKRLADLVNTMESIGYSGVLEDVLGSTFGIVRNDPFYYTADSSRIVREYAKLLLGEHND